MAWRSFVFECGDMETYTKDNIPVLNKWIHSMHRWKPDSAFQSHCILRVWLCGYKIIWYIYNIIKMSVLLIENNLKFKFTTVKSKWRYCVQMNVATFVFVVHIVHHLDAKQIHNLTISTANKQKILHLYIKWWYS